MTIIYKNLLVLKCALLFLLMGMPSFAQVSLVKDLNQNAQGSSPQELIDVNGVIFFSAESSAYGRELWKTDGTDAGTVMIKDINPGYQSSSPEHLISFNGKAYFVADNGIHGLELWTSDGTAEGTVMVKDIYEGSGRSEPAMLTVVNGQLVFQAKYSDQGRALWKSDGSATGTVIIKDNFSSDPYIYSVVNNTIFFQFNDNVNGTELWKSDGTTTGTVLVKDINSGASGSNPNRFAKINNLLYFTADDGIHGNEVWKSDGTEAGTVMVKDIVPGSGSSYAYLLSDVNGTLYFNANNRLWKSDGTDAGTVQVTNKVTNPNSLTNINGTLFFTGLDAVNGRELWKSDGTDAGTVLVKDIYSGEFMSNVYSIINVSGTAWFVAADAAHGSELWKSDGTEAGTVLVADITSGFLSSDIYHLYYFNGKFYFSCKGEQKGAELWKSDGTSAGTMLLKDINTGTIASYPKTLTRVDGKVYFTATNEEDNNVIYKTDGTAAGTSVLKEGIEGYSLTSVNQTLYFGVYTDSYGNELWKSDGTDAGTVMVKDIAANENGSNPNNLTAVNDILYFSASDENGNELWKSDGTAEGTIMVKDIEPGAGTSSPQDITNVQGTVYFTAYTLAHGKELWKTDGTATGTVMVKDMISGEESGEIDNLTASNGKLYFTYNTGQKGLYVSDGTDAGTKLLVTAWEGGIINNLTDNNGTLYFNRSDDDEGSVEPHDIELWKTDGTVAGTVLIKSIPKDLNEDCYPYELTPVNNILYFVLNLGSNRDELWKSNGTEAGTVLVKRLPAVSNSSGTIHLMNVNGVLYFQADFETYGRQLWMSMGSECNTIPLTTDSNIKVLSEWVLLNDKIILQGINPHYGSELYRYNTANDIKKPAITNNASNPASPILTSSGATGNQWFKDGIAINGATAANYAVNTSGVYSVKIIVADCLYATSDELTVVPFKITSQPANLVQCVGTNATFSVEASDYGPLTYQWKKAGANITGATSSTLEINQIKAEDGAVYTVEVNGSFGPLISNEATLTVNPQTTITNQPTDLVQCAGTNASLTVEASGTGTLTYQWKKAGAKIDGATSATLALNQIKDADAAAYSVDVTGTCGMISSGTVTLTVNPLTSITTQPKDVAQCTGTNASLTVEASGTGTLTYQWKKAGANIDGATSATLALSQIKDADAAAYSVDVTSTCGMASSNTATLTVNPLPVVTLADFAAVSTNHPAFELTGGAPAGGKYSVSGATVTQFQPTAAGNHTIVYNYTEPATGCSNSASKVLTVNTATGMDDVAQIAMSVKIYPNPAVDFFTLEINSPKKQEAELMIYNYGGKVVARETSILKEGVNKITFNGGQFSKGGYIVKIVTTDTVISQKFTLN